MDNADTECNQILKWFFSLQTRIIEVMSKLVTNVEVKNAYILNETNDREVVFSIHVPFEINSEFIDS